MKDMKLSELADELERLVSARNEPARLMRADHPQALQVAVATSNRIDRSLAEFVESNLPAILTALRDSTDRDAVTEQTVVDAILGAMNRANITSRALAGELGVSEARVCQMLRVGSNMTLQTVEKVFAAIRSLKSSPTNPGGSHD